MCGITGYVARPGQTVPPIEVAERMCNALMHRGPDSYGIEWSDRAFLGMRRLAIIDPEGGKQPVYSQDGAICAVFNGEIYNYRELQRHLESLGYRFTSQGDAECIVHAYAQYGAECFSKFRGMFAIAIWDKISGQLVLGRDRFGKKPLFYCRTGQGLAFASELKGLLNAPGVERRLNERVVSDYMMLGYIPSPHCIVEGVNKLMPGHFAVYRGGELTTRRYWQLLYTPKLEYSEIELIDRLDEQLNGAVKARLVSDVPFGAFLSGGIDSSLVVALMNRHLDRPVKTFTIGFAEQEFNEADDARLIADFVGTEHYELMVEPDILELTENIAWFNDEPLADSSAIPTYLVSRLAASHVKMVLTGDGGDEMFAGYERYSRYLRLHAIKHRGFPNLIPFLRLSFRLLPARQRRRAYWVCNRLGLPYPDDYLSGVAISTPQQVGRLISRYRKAPANYGLVRQIFCDGQEALGRLDSVLKGDVLTYLLDDILVKVDRMSMANSLEARAPLLDQQLAEFAARIPERYKMKGLSGKYLLKKVARRYLPDHCINKPKQGFAIPLAQWLRNELQELLLDTLHSRNFVERGMFDPRTARTIAMDHVRGRSDYSETLWALLMMELWAKSYLGRSRQAENLYPYPEMLRIGSV